MSSLIKLSLLSLALYCLTTGPVRAEREDDDPSLFVPTLALPTIHEVAIEGFDFDGGLVEEIETEHEMSEEADHHHHFTTTPAPKDANEIKFNTTDGVEPLMIYSTGVSIKGYWMRSKVSFDVVGTALKPPKTEPPSITQALTVFFDMLSIQPTASVKKPDEVVAVKTLNTIVGVDMDPNNKEVFWVELGKEPGIFSAVIEEEQFEIRHRRQYLGYTTLVDSGLHSPEDVALDVIGKNLYLTDAGLPAIVVCSVKHGQCKKVREKNVQKPRAIIADSATGWITYTDWGDKPGIYLVSMDGSKTETLIDTDVVWPNGLAADYQSDHLYWADARLSKVERINLKTKKRDVIIRDNAGNPFSLSLFEQRIYWSDWSGNDIKSCDKNFGNNTRVVLKTENIYGIHIYHPSIHQETQQISNPCWSKRCSHLCLLGPALSSFSAREMGNIIGTCACPESMGLGIDGSTCYDIHHSFLLYNAKNYIAQVFPERIGLDAVEKLISSKSHTIQDVAADWLRFRMFFFDLIKKSIYSVDLNDAHHVKVTTILSTNKDVSGLVYDTMTDNLYWLDATRGTLSQAPVTGKFEMVIRRDLIDPITMVLDKTNRAFYIAHKGAIMRADVTGNSNKDVVLVDSDISTPIALFLDESSWRLYWADSTLGTIESVAVDSNRARNRIVHRRRLDKLLAFTVYHDELVWSVMNSDYLHKVKTTAAMDEKTIVMKLPAGPSGNSSDPRRLIMIEPIRETGVGACHQRGCSHGCSLDSTHTATCLCPPTMQLVNKTVCTKPPTANPKVQLVVPAKVDPLRQPALIVVDHQTKPTSPPPIAAPHVTTHSPELPSNARLHIEEHAHSSEDVQIKEEREGNHMIWLIVLLLLLSVTGLATLAGLILYKQGRLPSQVSQLTVSFMPQSEDKDGAMLLVDEDA